MGNGGIVTMVCCFEVITTKSFSGLRVMVTFTFWILSFFRVTFTDNTLPSDSSLAENENENNYFLSHTLTHSPLSG